MKIKILALNMVISMFAFCFAAIAQEKSISGTVYDAVTSKPLPFASIVYNTKNHGIAADIDGRFTLKDPSKVEFLKFSYVGYVSKKLDKEILLENQQIEVFLSEETFDISEVVIYPGENPAHGIIKKVLENRKLNNPEQLDGFSCTSYNKLIITADLDNSKKIIKDTLSLTDSAKIDSGFIRAKKMLDKQHLFLMEAISERIYERHGKVNEKVIASRVSGFQQQSFILLATQMQSFSFYNEMITLMDSRYVSPISDGSYNRYFFHIEDTTYSATGDSVFIISFQPKRNRNFEGLKGILYINSNKYAIQSVVAEPVESNGMVDLKITQNYNLVDGKHWFPVELNTDMIFAKFIDAQAGDQHVKFVGIGKSYLSNIKINPDLSSVKFKAIELQVSDIAHKQSDSLWLVHRHDSLSGKDLRTYEFMDSIGKKENLDVKLKLFKTLASGHIPFHFIDINVLSVLSFNMYEGFRTGLGIRTNDKISKYFSIGGYSAYGFKDKQWKYGGNIDFVISRVSQVNLGFAYKKDVLESSGYRFFEDQVSFNSSEAYRSFFIADMTYNESVTANFSFRALKRFKFNLYASRFTMQNTSPYRFLGNGDSDIPSTKYAQNEIGFQFKYAPNESFAYMAGELFSMNPYHSPVLYLNVIQGIKNFNSEFDYLKIESKLNINFLTKSFGRTNLQLVGAKVFGDLPYFMLYNGHESYYDFAVETANSFATMRMNEFLSDEFFSIHFSQDFGGLLFKGKKFRPKIIISNSFGFGRLSKPELHADFEFKTLEKGYYESGLVINNIIKQLGFVGYGFGVYYRYGPYSFSNNSDNFAYKLTLTFEL